MIVISLSIALGITLPLLIVLSYYCYYLRKMTKHKLPDATAQEVLSELMAGPIVMKMELIEKGSIVQWRNR